MIDYDPTNWYWLADDGRVFSSAVGGLVADGAPAYVAWRAAGGRPTRWPTDDEGRQTDAALAEVLAPYGVTVATDPVTIAAATKERYRLIIAETIEATARARGYDSAVACASYAVSTIPGWAAEAQAFVAWRDAVWAWAIGLMADVSTGTAAAPDEADLLAAMPAMVWPD